MTKYCFVSYCFPHFIFTGALLQGATANKIPAGEMFELPGRPHVCYCLRSYGDESFGSPSSGAKCARDDFGFLFKAFESGQTPPHRLKKDSSLGHAPTIHQYLDWTITGTSPLVRLILSLASTFKPAGNTFLNPV
jgi:hypothetical protein